MLRQAHDQLDATQRALGLTRRERSWVGRLGKGWALWLVGGHRAVVQHHLAASEMALVDTDGRMRETSHEFTRTEGTSSGNSTVDAA